MLRTLLIFASLLAAGVALAPAASAVGSCTPADQMVYACAGAFPHPSYAPGGFVGAGTSEDSPVGGSSTLLMACVPVPGVLRCALPNYGHHASDAGRFWMNGNFGDYAGARVFHVIASFDSDGNRIGYGAEPLDLEARCYDFGTDGDCDHVYFRLNAVTEEGVVARAYGYRYPYGQAEYSVYWLDVETPAVAGVDEGRDVQATFVCRAPEKDRCDTIWFTVTDGNFYSGDSRVVQVIRHDEAVSACVYDDAASALNAAVCRPPF